MKSPVTIVIPTYNREATILRTLDSVAAQTLKAARIVLVDNNSTDATLSIMQSWAKNHPELEVIVKTEPRQGACAARNCGLEEVESEFVMFFDSDDVMLPRHVEDFSNAIRSNPGIDIFGRDIYVVELDGKSHKLYFESRDPMFNHIFRSSLSTQRFVARTSLVRKAGGWGENLPGWDDYELGVRLLLLTGRVFKLPDEPTVITYRLAESLTGTSFSARPQAWEHALDVIESHFRKAKLPAYVRLVDARRMILASQYHQECHAKSSISNDPVKEAKRLQREVLASTDSPLRMRLIYLHNRIFKRLTWVLARVLFPLP